jgi:universal stress protein E
MQKIVAATDLSAPARHAAERAAIISSHSAGKLELVHVADLSTLERLRLLISEQPADMQYRVVSAGQERLAELALSLKQRFDVHAGTHIVMGNLLSELIQTCQALSADLLVCGAKGESFIRHFSLGTTALRLLNKSPCPVLVVKQPPHEAYKRVLVPVDFSFASLAAIQHARSLAPHSMIILMHAFEVPFEGKMRYANISDDIIHEYKVLARREALQKLEALRQEANLPVAESMLIVQHGDSQINGQPSALKPGDDVFQIQLV